MIFISLCRMRYEIESVESKIQGEKEQGEEVK